MIASATQLTINPLCFWWWFRLTVSRCDACAKCLPSPKPPCVQYQSKGLFNEGPSSDRDEPRKSHLSKRHHGRSKDHLSRHLVNAVTVVVRERSNRTVNELRSIIEETSMNLFHAVTVAVVESSRGTVNAVAGSV